MTTHAPTTTSLHRIAMVFSVRRPIKPDLRPPPAAAAALTDRPTEKKAASHPMQG